MYILKPTLAASEKLQPEAGDPFPQTLARVFWLSLLAGALDVEFEIYAWASEAGAQLVHMLFGCVRCWYICCSHEPSVVCVCECFFVFVDALDADFAIYVTWNGDVFFITERPGAGSTLSPFPL